jgi:hypothetical protein
LSVGSIWRIETAHWGGTFSRTVNIRNHGTFLSHHGSPRPSSPELTFQSPELTAWGRAWLTE